MANIKSFPNNHGEFYGAEDVMRWLHGRSSGVFGADGNAAVAPVLDAMAVTVSDGNGWMSNGNSDGVVWWIDDESQTGAKMQLPVELADAALPRIDRVVVSWQTTNYVALPEVTILKGTPASNPKAPALTNNNVLRQISLASIRIPASVTAITASMITDERMDASVCGLVTCGIGVDTSVMQSKFESFWSETIEEQEAYIAEQKAGWDAFFKNVEYDTLVPVPTGSDSGKVIIVNADGDGYTLGEAQTEIPITSEVPEDSDIWIDPDDGEDMDYDFLTTKDTVTIEQGGTGATTVPGIKTNLGVGTELWSGSWSGGNITVPDTDKYTVFLIKLSDYSVYLPAIKTMSNIRGLGGYAAAETVITVQLACTFSGNTWTFGNATSMIHKTDATRTLAARSVEKIIGLV